MKTFNTFAHNSPSYSQYQSPKPPSSNYFATSDVDSRHLEQQKTAHFIRNTIKKIPSVEILKNDNENDKQSSVEDHHSEVSLLLSQVSVPVAQRPQYTSERLFNLQNNITKHVLELRQQKISLMQQLSQSIDTKNLFEHYLLLKEKQDDRQTQYDSRIVSQTPKSPKSIEEETVPIHISAQILKRNQQLHRKLKQLEVRQEIFGTSYKQLEADDPQSKKILQEIMQVRQLNNNLQKQISDKLKRSNAKDSRFVTFEPKDKLKHQQLLTSHEDVEKLKKKYQELVNRNNEPEFKLTQEQIQYVQGLRQQNQQLLRQVEQMMRRKADSNIGALRQKLDENQRQKAIFLSELQKFKMNLKAIKQQNNRLKQQINR